MSVTSDNPAHPWSSEKGMLLYRDHPVGMLYLGGDSLMPNPRLADVVAMRLNHYEEVNPGRLEVDDLAGVTTTEFARGPEDTGTFEWEDEAQTPPRAAPPTLGELADLLDPPSIDK